MAQVQQLDQALLKNNVVKKLKIMMNISEIKSLTQQFVPQGKCQPLLLSHVKQGIHPADLKVHFQRQL